MSEVFELKVLAADKTFYDDTAVSIVIPAMDGEIQIMAHHENMVFATGEGIIRIRKSDEEPERRGIVGIGFVKVTDNKVTMLVDSAEWPEDVDRARAQEALERAQEQLRQDRSIQEYNISRAAMARAMTRLSESSKVQNLD